jgi:3-methylfumaryl-CoA hydratase
MNADDGPGDSPGRRSRTQLRIGTWEETEEFVGTSFPTVRGADAVEAGAIRRRLEVLEWDCPLHCDTHGSGSDGGPIAPATMVGTFAMPAYWVPGDAPMYEDGMAKLPPLFLDQIPAPGARMLVTEWALETYRYLRPGDQVNATTTVMSAERKRTRLGEGVFLTLRTEYTDQRDVVVAVRELTVLRF